MMKITSKFRFFSFFLGIFATFMAWGVFEMVFAPHSCLTIHKNWYDRDKTIIGSISVYEEVYWEGKIGNKGIALPCPNGPVFKLTTKNDMGIIAEEISIYHTILLSHSFIATNNSITYYWKNNDFITIINQQIKKIRNLLFQKINVTWNNDKP